MYAAQQLRQSYMRSASVVYAGDRMHANTNLRRELDSTSLQIVIRAEDLDSAGFLEIGNHLAIFFDVGDGQVDVCASHSVYKFWIVSTCGCRRILSP